MKDQALRLQTPKKALTSLEIIRPRQGFYSYYRTWIPIILDRKSKMAALQLGIFMLLAGKYIQFAESINNAQCIAAGNRIKAMKTGMARAKPGSQPVSFYHNGSATSISHRSFINCIHSVCYIELMAWVLWGDAPLSLALPILLKPLRPGCTNNTLIKIHKSYFSCNSDSEEAAIEALSFVWRCARSRSQFLLIGKGTWS